MSVNLVWFCVYFVVIVVQSIYTLGARDILGIHSGGLLAMVFLFASSRCILKLYTCALNGRAFSQLLLGWIIIIVIIGSSGGRRNFQLSTYLLVWRIKRDVTMIRETSLAIPSRNVFVQLHTTSPERR